MSYLSNELSTILKQKGMFQVDINKKTGLGTANVSRIFSGSQEFVTNDDLDKIIVALTNKPSEQGKIVKARLHDAYSGRYASLVQINIRGGATPAERFTPNVSLAPDVRAALEYLSERVFSDPQVGELLVLQARALGLGMKG